MKQNKLVVFFASPRPNGFTKALFDQALQVLSEEHFEIKIIAAYKQNVLPCIDCRCCEKGPCPFNAKDDYEEILHELEDATHLLIASPIYFAGVPSPMKAIMDRSQQFFMNRAENRSKRFPMRRQGISLLAAGASDVRVNDATNLAIEMFFRCMNADFVDTFVLENTDQLSNCPTLPDTFLSQWATHHN